MHAARSLRNRIGLTAFVLLALVGCGGAGVGGEPPVAQPPIVQAPVVLPLAPAITTQPQSQTVVAGNSVTFAVAASGDAPLSFQWLRSGAEVLGATQSTFTIAAALMQESGNRWSVRVMNAAGSVTSAQAMLTVTPAPIALGISLTAGSSSGAGNLDGQGRAAYFGRPSGMAFNAAGDLYVGDALEGTVRKVTPDGTVTTFAGQPGASGIQDGTAPRLQLLGGDMAFGKDGILYMRGRALTPQAEVIPLAAPINLLAVATAPDGTLFGATGTAVYQLLPSVTRIAGLEGAMGSTDGIGSAVRFFEIADIAVDSARNIYVSDPRMSVIRKIAPDNVVTTLAGATNVQGSVDGTGGAARFFSPWTLALDAAENLWVAEIGSGRFRKVTPAGVVSTPFIPQSRFFSDSGTYPVPMAFAPSGDLYFGLERGIARINQSGAVTFVAGQEFVREPSIGNGDGLVTDAAGNVVVPTRVPAGGVRFEKYAASGERLAFQATAPVIRFPFNSGIGADAQGNVYVSSATSRAVDINVDIPTGGSIIRVGSDSAVSTLVSWVEGSANALAPGYLTVGRDGAFYFVDLITGNLVKWTAASGATVIANVGPVGFLVFTSPWLIAADAGGKVYVMKDRVVKRVENGALVTVAGAAGVSGTADGPGAQARFVLPSGIAVDAAGNLFIADREVVRKVTPEGVVSTVVGQRGRIGLRTGSLPGSLGRISAIAIGPDGLLHLASDNALVKVRFN